MWQILASDWSRRKRRVPDSCEVVRDWSIVFPQCTHQEESNGILCHDEFLDTHIDHTICIDWWKLSKEAKRKEFRRKEVRRKEVRKEKKLSPQTIKKGLCGKIQVFRHPYRLYYLYWVVEASKGGQEAGVQKEGSQEGEWVTSSNHHKWIIWKNSGF